MQRESEGHSRAPASLPDLYPLKVLRTEPAGRVFHHELTPAEATHVLKAYRPVLAWCRRMAEPTEAFDPAPATALLADLVASSLPEDLRQALLMLCLRLARKPRDPHHIALACLEVGDCAVARGARRTALLWGEAAADAVPLNPRFCWLVGKLHRKWANYPDAEYWLSRTVRAAVRVKDRYVEILALNSIGNLHLQKGAYTDARAPLLRAQRLAKRYRLRELEGEILHDLCFFSLCLSRYADAERYGTLALERYGPAHPNTPRLQHDLALIFLKNASCERALSVYHQVLPHFTTSPDRLRTLASMVRCAGGIRDRDLFERYWTEAWATAQDPAVEDVLASTLVDMGIGARDMGEWERAKDVLIRAKTHAELRGERDMLAAADSALQEMPDHGAQLCRGVS